MDLVLSTGQGSAIESICGLDWSSLSETEMTGVALAYYYFSIQFRENLLIACDQNPDDALLARLHHEECATANLSPWQGVAAKAEAMDHDEFMRRLLDLSPIPPALRTHVQPAGERYLSRVRALDPALRAASIAVYEDGGLERLFREILRYPDWHTPLLQAFRHFLQRHIDFDGNPLEGHGALVRHLGSASKVDVLWDEFRALLCAIPGIDSRFSATGLDPVVSPGKVCGDGR